MIARLTITVGLLSAMFAHDVAANGTPDIEFSRVQHDYLLSCAGCHRFDGQGSGDVPSLDETFKLLSLPGGRAYLAGVPGVAQAPLDDERLADLLNWVIKEFGGGDEFEPYRTEEVGQLRAEPLRSPREVRAALLAE